MWGAGAELECWLLTLDVVPLTSVPVVKSLGEILDVSLFMEAQIAQDSVSPVVPGQATGTYLSHPDLPMVIYAIVT